jgi:hypothetical protein
MLGKVRASYGGFGGEKKKNTRQDKEEALRQTW